MAWQKHSYFTDKSILIEIDWNRIFGDALTVEPSELLPGGWKQTTSARSCHAHCDQNLAVEVQPWIVRSEAGSWGPAVPTARGSWRRVGRAEVDVEVESEVVEEKEEDEEEVKEKEPEQLW